MLQTARRACQRQVVLSHVMRSIRENSHWNNNEESELTTSSSASTTANVFSQIQERLRFSTLVPEGSETAASWNCVNKAVLSGTVERVQSGFWQGESVMQLIVRVEDDNAGGTAPLAVYSVLEEGTNVAVDRELIAARFSGRRVLVEGQLRMVQAVDATTLSKVVVPTIQLPRGELLTFVTLL